MKKAILTLLVLTVCGPAVRTEADVRVVGLRHTDGFQVGEFKAPPQDAEIIEWIGKDRYCSDYGIAALLVRNDLGKVLFVDHVEQTFSQLDMPVDLEALVPQEMRASVAPGKAKIFAAPLLGEKKILGFSAKSYRAVFLISGIVLDFKVWAAPDLVPDQEAYHEMNTEIFKLTMGITDSAMLEMDKIEGVTVELAGVMAIPSMGVEDVVTFQRTKTIEERDAPAGVYDVPEGYREVPFDYALLQERMAGN